jgi:hypothetical protein
MKKAVLFILLTGAVALNGCAPTLYPEIDERLTTLPVAPHTNEVEVFFAGEWPKDEYIKLAAMEAWGGTNTAYIELIKHLKLKAQSHGADAVILQEKNELSNVHTTAARNIETTTWSVLTGVAIKYKKNLDTSIIPKRQQVEIYDHTTDTFQPLINLMFTPDGDIQAKEELHENAARMYSQYIGNYTMRHIKESGPSWSSRMQEGYVVEREQHIGGMLQMRMEFDYDAARRVTQIRINNMVGISEEINFVYDEAGRLSQRTILRSSKPFIEEIYSYNADGEAYEVQIFNTNLPLKTPFLRSTYTYYTLEEI